MRHVHQGGDFMTEDLGLPDFQFYKDAKYFFGLLHSKLWIFASFYKRLISSKLVRNENKHTAFLIFSG